MQTKAVFKENQRNGSNVQSEAKKNPSSPQRGRKPEQLPENFPCKKGSAVCLELMRLPAALHESD